MKFTIRDCENIINNLTQHELIVIPHFKDRITTRSLEITGDYLKYLKYQPKKQ